jgi:hypothetical protein
VPRCSTIAKEFGLDVRLGDGGAVQLDEDLVAALALGVDGASDQLLAGARFAVDEHPAVGGRHETNLLAQSLDRNALAGQGRADVELALELQVFRSHAPRLDGIFEHDQRAVERERLFQKVIGAQFGGFDGGFNSAVAADDDHLRPRCDGLLVDVGEHVESVTVGQPDVEQNHVVGGVIEQHQSLGRVGRRGHSIALLAENLLERRANLVLVVHYQNVIHACDSPCEVTVLDGEAE